MDFELRLMAGSAISDLIWYFNQSESDLGLRSNHEAIINRLSVGRRQSEGPPIEVTEQMLERAARSRNIERALRAMDPDDLHIVWLAFGASWPAELGDYGEIAALASHTKATRQAHGEAGTALPMEEWLARIGRSRDDVTALRAVREIHREAFALRHQGVVAYLEARRKVGPHG